jgi:hypothetical protein
MKRTTILLTLFVITLARSQDIKLNGTVSAENHQIKNVADPTEGKDAVSNSYLQSELDKLINRIEYLENSDRDFYIDEADAISGLYDAYAQLKEGTGYYRQWFLSNLYAASDQGTSSWRHGNFRAGTIVSTDPLLEGPWNEMYSAINSTNIVIERIQDTQMDESLKARILGEAKFLRGLHYFNLVRCFGEVPLRTSSVQPGEGGLAVSPISDIYLVIIEDLTAASQDCWGFGETRNGFTNDIGRATNAAAHALLSKVYLRIASAKRTAEAGIEGNAKFLEFTETTDFYYQKAKEHADAAISQGDYALVGDLDSWVEIFGTTNGNNTEMLFDIQGLSWKDEQGTALSNLFSPRGAGLSADGWGGTNKLHPKFINFQIDKTDPRYQNSIVREYQDATRTYVLTAASTGYTRSITNTGAPAGNLNMVYTAKYVDSNATTEYSSRQNWHVIRLADVYLMRAEAMAELSQNPADAAADINALRQRVGAADLDMAGMSMDDFRTALLRERGVELYMEGHRFFDLTRMGVYDEYCRTVFGNDIGARQAEDYFWPIPSTETSANENIN